MHFNSAQQCFLLQVRIYLDVDVTPTLNMALFDWTDYEDMRPADKQLNKRSMTIISQK